MSAAGAELSVSLPVLGINTHFVTNSERVLEIVEDAFGGWRVVDADGMAGWVSVRILVHDGERVGPMRHSFADVNRLIVHAPGSIGVSDASCREAVATVTTALVADAAFGETVVEALTFWLLSHLDRHPIHASAIARDNHAILLLGPSGSGKSTLAHLAYTAGITTLADDHVWIQQPGSGTPARVWGQPGRARLLVPDIGQKRFTRLDGARNDRACYSADHPTVCVLAHGNAASLERVGSAVILAALVDRVDPGFDRFPERHATVASVLANGGGWRLTLSDTPSDALPHLQTMLNT